MRHAHCTAVLTDVTLEGTGIDIDKLKKTFYVTIHFDRNSLKNLKRLTELLTEGINIYLTVEQSDACVTADVFCIVYWIV